MLQIQSDKGLLNQIAETKESLRNIQLEMLNILSGFSVQKFQEDQLKLVLIRLAFVLNSGWKFNEQVKEQLFFGITKFSFYENPFLRRLIFKILNMLNLNKYTYIIFQSLIRDLSSGNQYVRFYALQFIPTLDDENNIHQVEKYIINALLDKNQYLYNHAMILGLKLFNRYPNFITNLYSAIIIQRLGQSFVEDKQHSLNLIHEIKKADSNSFLKIIILLKLQELTSVVKQQMMKYIKEILIKNELHTSAYHIELQQYLLSQMYYSESIIFFEAAGLVIQVESIKNHQLQPMMKFIMNYLNSIVSNIYTYSALKLIQKLFQNPERINLIQDEYIDVVEKLTFNPHISVSSSAIFICIQYQLLKENRIFAEYLKQLYLSSGQPIDFNFLFGILELVHIYHYKGDQITKFLHLILPQCCPVELANIAFEIAEQIFDTQMVNLVEAMQIFFLIAQSYDVKLKLKVIKLVHKHWIPEPKNLKTDTDSEILKYYQILQNAIFPRLNIRFSKLNIQYQSQQRDI